MAKKYTLYKPDIIRSVHNALPEYKRSDIKKIVNQYNEEIIKALEDDHDINIVNFGKFDINEVKRHYNFNNLLKEEMDKNITYAKVTFSSSNKLKRRVNKKDDK